MSFDVVITGFRAKTGQSPAAVLEDLFGFEPDKAQSLVRSFPSSVIQGTTEIHAQIAAEQLREAGAEVEIRARNQAAALSLNQAADMAKVAAKLLEASPAHAQAQPASRKVFSTVAMKNIEADLNKFELEGFGAGFGEEAKSASSSAFDAPMDDLPFEKALPVQAKKTAAKAELPDVDDLFEAPPPKHVDQGGFDADDGGGLDDLFRRPGDEFRKPASNKNGRGSNELKSKRGPQQKGWDSPSNGKVGQGAESKGWDGAQGKGWDQAGSAAGDAAGAAGAEGAKAAGGLAFKAIAAKVAAGVAAISIAAGASAAVMSSREAAAEAKQMQQIAAKSAEGKGPPPRKLHPAIKLAPAALENSFASVLRKRVPNTFTVAVEWDGAPDDMQCMLIKKHKSKHKERMDSLEQTGKRLVVPPEGQEQLKEHIEGMKAANGTSKAEYEGACFSVQEHPEGSKPDAEEKARSEAKKRERAEEAEEE